MALKKNQQGIVLIVALVFLVALTAVGSVLMQNTTSDVKMAGATEDKFIATQDIISATEEVIYHEINQTDGSNIFAGQVNSFPAPTKSMTKDVTVDIDLASSDTIEVDCPRMRLASSIDLFKCNMITLQVNKNFGRKKSHQLTLDSGIAQQIINVGN